MFGQKQEWPNRRGYDIQTGRGCWDIWKPDLSTDKYCAVFFPTGEPEATRRGVGDSPEAAIKASVRVNL